MHERQHRLGVLCVDERRDAVGVDVLAPADPHGGVVVGLEDEPGLGLAVGAAKVPRRVRAGGMHVHGKTLPGVEQFHQHARVARLAVVAAEPVPRIGENRITKQRAVFESCGSETWLAVTGDGGADPLLG